LVTLCLVNDQVPVVRPLPGRTIPDIVSQLTWRVLGPYNHRAHSVLAWAGLMPKVSRQPSGIAAFYGITDRTVGHRVNRVAAAGRLLPLDPYLELEIIRPSRAGEDHLALIAQGHHAVNRALTLA
jgi:hypothetical protein